MPGAGSSRRGDGTPPLDPVEARGAAGSLSYSVAAGRAGLESTTYRRQSSVMARSVATVR